MYYSVNDERTIRIRSWGSESNRADGVSFTGWMQLPETMLIASIGIGVQKTELPTKFTILFG
jgi:hypothetical protein